MTDNEYTPSSRGTGVIADSGDRRPGTGDEVKSWNRWQNGGSYAPPAEAGSPDDEPTDGPGAEHSEVVASSTTLQDPEGNGAVQADGYVPMRRSQSTKRRSRRGGGRHRLNERKWSRASRSRRGRRVEDPEPRHEAAPEPREEVTPEPDHEVTPDPGQEVAGDLHYGITSEPRDEVTPEPSQEVAGDLHNGITSEPHHEVAPEPHHEGTPDPGQEVAGDLHYGITSEPRDEVTPEPHHEVTPEPSQEFVGLHYGIASEPHGEASPESRNEVAAGLHYGMDIAPEPDRDVGPEPHEELAPEPLSEVSPAPQDEVASEMHYGIAFAPDPNHIAPEPRHDIASEPRHDFAPEPDHEITPEPGYFVPELRDEPSPQPQFETLAPQPHDFAPEPRNDIAPPPDHVAFAPEPRYESAPQPRYDFAERRYEIAPDPHQEREHEPSYEPEHEPRIGIDSGDREDIGGEVGHEAAPLTRHEAVAELRTLTAPESTDEDREPRRRMADARETKPGKAIDELIEGKRPEPRRKRTRGRAADPQTERHAKARRAPAVDTEPAPRRRRVRLSTKFLAVAVAVLAAVIAFALLRKTDASPQDSGTSNGIAGSESITTTLIAGTEAPGQEAVWLTLLSYDGRTNEGAVVYVPAHTAVEVPGRGLQGVGNSLSDGDIELLVLSAKSLLNVEIDNYLELTPEDAQALLSSIGPVTVDVPDEVRVGAGGGTARLLFTSGVQELTPDRAVELLYTAGLESDELDLGPRHLAFWDGLLDSYEDDPNALAAAVASAGDVGRADAELSAYADVIASIAEAGSQARNLSVLPVASVSVGDSELYTIDEVELGEFMRTTAHAEAPSHDAIRVQVLNGNGYPGIGAEVADRLLGSGFRVVLSGNARDIDQSRTLIVTYDATPEGLELAQQARDLLGVGEVQVSRLDQGIVDLTIVVGKDFLRKP